MKIISSLRNADPNIRNVSDCNNKNTDDVSSNKTNTVDASYNSMKWEYPKKEHIKNEVRCKKYIENAVRFNNILMACEPSPIPEIEKLWYQKYGFKEGILQFYVAQKAARGVVL